MCVCVYFVCMAPALFCSSKLTLNLCWDIIVIYLMSILTGALAMSLCGWKSINWSDLEWFRMSINISPSCDNGLFRNNLRCRRIDESSGPVQHDDEIWRCIFKATKTNKESQQSLNPNFPSANCAHQVFHHRCCNDKT